MDNFKIEHCHSKFTVLFNGEDSIKCFKVFVTIAED